MTTPASKPPCARQIGDGGRRHDAGAGHNGAFAGGAVCELGLDRAAGLARVAANQEPRPLITCLSRRSLNVTRAAGNLDREIERSLVN